jgi:two-component system, sensor histidine kinase and response regulator
MAEPIIGQDRSLRRARMSRWLAACSVALGVGVLFGWFLGLDPMTRVLPGLITMKPNAALGFLLAGLALGSIREVHPAGRQAVEALAISPGDFDAVLMDLAMPEMGGFQALEAIRLRERIEGGRLPIVALTAHAMAGDRERCLAAGFDGYLAKPVQAARLAEALARVVGLGAGEVDDQAPGPDDPTAAALPAFDLAAALKGLDGDEPLLLEILGLFLEDAPRLMAEARRAIEAGDAATLMRTGHILAGSAGHFAAGGVVEAARKLEEIGKAGDLSGAENAARAFAGEFERFRRAAVETIGPSLPPPGLPGNGPG